MVKSNMGNSIGKIMTKGLSSRSPKDAGSPSVKMAKGAVVSVRKANNKGGGKKGKGC